MVANEVARLVRTDELVQGLSSQIATDAVLDWLDTEELRETLTADPYRAWDGVIDERARKLVAAKTDQIKAAVRKAIAAAMEEDAE
jgi:hypothetical protein